MSYTTDNASSISLALFLLRQSIFITMAMWTMDKFLRPEHAAAIFEHYYGLADLGVNIVYILASAETALLLAFLVGLKPRITYGMVLILHGISTLASYKQYINPFEGSNLLFFAALPMLAACFALYILRDFDTWRVSICLCSCKKNQAE